MLTESSILSGQAEHVDFETSHIQYTLCSGPSHMYRRCMMFPKLTALGHRKSYPANQNYSVRIYREIIQ